MAINTQKLLDERSTGISIVLGVVLLFLLINFSTQLGMIFGLMLLVDYIMFNNIGWNKFTTTISMKGFIIGVFGYAAFLLSSTLIIGALGQASAILSPVESVLKSIAASTPIFEGSKSLTLLGWGVIIPIVETRFFFGRVLEGMAHRFKVPLNFTNKKIWVVFTLVSLLFMAFHFTAKAITATSFDFASLTLTFLFGMVSCIIVVWTKDLFAAIMTHIANNTIATSIRLGLPFIGSVLGVEVSV